MGILIVFLIHFTQAMGGRTMSGNEMLGADLTMMVALITRGMP